MKKTAQTRIWDRAPGRMSGDATATYLGITTQNLARWRKHVMDGKGPMGPTMYSSSSRSNFYLTAEVELFGYESGLHSLPEVPPQPATPYAWQIAADNMVKANPHLAKVVAAEATAS